MPQMKGYLRSFLVEYLAQAQENIPAQGKQWWTSPVQHELEQGRK